MPTTLSASDPAPALIELARGLAEELRPGRPRRTVTLDSSLENDLGIDSLARVELLLRIERQFGVALPDQAAMGAETLGDLARALAQAAPAAAAAAPSAALAKALEAVGEVPDRAETLVEILEWHAARHPDRPHITLIDEKENLENITYGELLRGAQEVAAGLRALDLEPGRPVAIMLPSGRAYFETFFGALLAGGIAVPLYPPTRVTRIEEHVRRQARILDNCRATVLVTMEEVGKIGGLLKSLLPELKHVVTRADLKGPPPDRLRLRPDALALLQYTSGSTGDPKGVALTHANLIANIHAMHTGCQATSTDVFVSWLPLYHDMGLIGAWLGSLYVAFRLVLMSPTMFIARPIRWLKAMHDHRGTMSAAPNFAFELCATKLDDAALAGLDLSPWRIAFNGAEPVHPDTIDRFLKRFAPFGFRREAMCPVFGLAENCLGVTFPPLDRGPIVDAVKRDEFQLKRRAVPAEPGDPHALRFVGCGRPVATVEIRILDDAHREAGDREVGRVQFRGPSAMSGYYRNPEATRKVLDEGWIDTGDLGYVADGELYVTGRAKDMIIRGGRNIHPQELEEAVGQLPGIREGFVAVFGTHDARTGTERLVVAAETRAREDAAREDLVKKIRDLGAELLDAPPDDVVLVPPGGVPKTPSGKVRRSAARDLYESGRLGKVRSGVLWQFVRLSFSGVGPGLGRLARAAAFRLFAVWAWTFGLSFGLALWFGILLLPGLRLRRALIRAGMRFALPLLGARLRISGLDRLPPGPHVLAPNHSSYIDSLALYGLLPPRYAFVAKKELLNSFLSRIFLRRLGTLFVERFDPKEGVQDTAAVVAALRQGACLVVYPEGTFRRAPGLRPFHMGAFLTAAQAGVPLVPLTVRGSRSVLRDKTWVPRCGTIAASVGPTLEPEGNDWAAAVKLRDATRAEILRGCGEPDLVEV
ncbi:MAG: AMP-binding protein [Planctomycetes bacterium]|nr:AMP-binding protein [Planctomycetota bacterium]